jgi:hypothetical protein
VKKIKKFKIHFTPYYIKQFIKKSYSSEPQLQQQSFILPENVEELINDKIDELKKILLPAVIYDTLPYEKIKDLLPYEINTAGDTTTTTTRPSKLYPNKVSIFAVNIDTENRLIKDNTNTAATSPLDALLTKAIINDAINKSVNFVKRLIEEEIGKEPFVLDAIHIVSEKDKIDAISSLLETAKINITDLSKQQDYTVTGYTYWLSRRKYITLARAATALNNKKTS